MGRFSKSNTSILSNKEIENIKKCVPQALKGVSHLIIIENEENLRLLSWE